MEAGRDAAVDDAAPAIPQRERDPVVPEPAGSCPALASGLVNVMGMNLYVLAGEPGSTPGPMLFAWHGSNDNGREQLSALGPIADDIVSRGGIVVAPSNNGEVRDGADVTIVLRTWYTGDLEIVDHVVACAVRHHNIDLRRIYATGCSAGGLMAGAMSLLRSSYVAAAVTDSGGLVGTVALEDPARVPAALTMHEGDNSLFGISFEDTSQNYQSILSRAGAAMVIECPHLKVHCGAPLELRWSAWKFLDAHPFGTDPSPYRDGLPAEMPEYCRIW